MALFKISKGPAANLGKVGNATQQAQEGFAYFTPDDGKFYIDIEDANTAVIGTNRIPLNAERADGIRIQSTDNGIARFDGTSGAIQDSQVTIDDSNHLTTPASIRGAQARFGAYLNRDASSESFFLVDANLITGTDRKIDNTGTLAGENDEEWLQALLRAICNEYPGEVNATFKGILTKDNIKTYYEVFIYNTNEKTSNGLPRYTMGTYRPYGKKFQLFGTEDYVFYLNDISSGGLSGNFYWADQLVSATSNAQTEPTFKKVTIGNSVSGIELTDSLGNQFGGLWHNGSALWIGAKSTSLGVTPGGLFLHAGLDNSNVVNNVAYLFIRDTQAPSGASRPLVHGQGGSSTTPVYVAATGEVMTISGKITNDTFGNADTATQFADETSIALTGDVTGTATSYRGWSIATTIANGVITNAKIANPYIELANINIPLGSAITANELKTALGLTNAVHYIGKAVNTVTDGGTQDPGITGYDIDDAQLGDIILDRLGEREYIWGPDGWELLGPVDSTEAAVSYGTQNRMAYYSANNTISSAANHIYGNYTYTLSASDTSDVYFSASNSNGSVRLLASTYRGLHDPANGRWIIAIDGNATHTYVPLWANTGSLTQPIYFNGDGEPRPTSYALEATVNDATQNGVAYYSTSTEITSTDAGSNGALLEGKGASLAPTWHRSENGAVYATAQDGSLQWGTLPTAQGGTGNTSYTSDTLIYAENNTKLSSYTSTRGGPKTLWYLDDGVPIDSSATEGSFEKPIYLNAGTVTALNPVWLLKGGTAITTDTELDLNNYLTIGNYYVASTSYADDILHTPYSNTASSSMTDGVIKVYSALGSSADYLKQEYIQYNSGRHFVRHKQGASASWTGWRAYAFTPAGTDIAIGAGGLEQPIYVKATGELASTTYHLKAHIEDGTQYRAAYYSNSSTIEDAGSIYMDDSHIGVNGTNTSYQFYVNGVSYLQRAATDANADGVIISHGKLQITNYSKTLHIGSANSGWYHFVGDDKNIQFYFDPSIQVNGYIAPYSDSNFDVGLTDHHWRVGYFDQLRVSTDTEFTAANSGKGGTEINSGSIELVGSTPFIDFHQAYSTADRTGRIIQSAAAGMEFSGTAATTAVSVNSLASAQKPLFKFIGETFINGVLDVSGNTNLTNNVYISSTSTNRARLYLRTYADQPNDLWLGANNTDKWSITCRNSAENYLLGIYSAAKSYVATFAQDTGVTTINYGLEVKGHIATSNTATTLGARSGGGYHSSYNNIVLYGDASTGSSGLVFLSSKGTANNNMPSDRAFIQYHALGITTASADATNPTLVTTSGESGKLVIGIGNDADDQIWLQVPSRIGLIKQIVNTSYVIPDTGNTTGTVGAATRPVYVNAGAITQGTYELKATVNSGTTNYIAYYSSATQISPTLNAHFNWSNLSGTTKGYEELVLGDKNNRFGRLALYSHTQEAGGGYIVANNPSSWITHTLPDTAGWLVTAATSGAGTSTRPVYVNANGVATAVSSIGEDYLSWGGHDIGTNSWSPIDVVLNDYTRGNGFAMLPAANITVQHSTNSGSAWTTTSITDLVKRNLVTNNQSGVRIVASGNVPNNATPQLRITIKCSGATYFQLKKIHLLISTSYSTGCTVTILGSLNSAPTTFNQTICSNVGISGWAGWNSITCDHVVGAGTNQIHSLQFTFKQTGINPDHTNSGLTIYNISGYGYMKHTSPSTLALWSHAYTIDGDTNITLPSTSSLIISKSVEASGTADNKPALIVGGLSTAGHIEIDSNKILAKSNGTTPTTLYLQDTTGTVSVAGSGGLIVSSLTASQAVSTDANKKLVSSNLTTTDPSASGSGITYIASISQSAVGKITATKSTVRSASTSQTGVLQFTTANTNTQLELLPTSWTAIPTDDTLFIRKDTSGSASFGQVKFSTLWTYIKNHITTDLYWANIKVQSANATDKVPSFSYINLTNTGSNGINFSRTDGVNYLNTPTGGGIGISIGGVAYANCRLILQGNAAFPGASNTFDLGTSTYFWKTAYVQGGVYIKYTAATDHNLIALSGAPNYGIRYKEGSPDTLKLSASNNANSDSADLCINAHGDGTIATRNNRIPHTGNTTGTVGTATRPVYVDAGTIKQGTYTLNATINSGATNYLAYYSGANTIDDDPYLHRSANYLYFQRSDATAVGLISKNSLYEINFHVAASGNRGIYQGAPSDKWLLYWPNNSDIGYVQSGGLNVNGGLRSTTLITNYATKTAWNDGKAGAYIGADGTIQLTHATGEAYIGLHRAGNTAATGYVQTSSDAAVSLGGTAANLTYNSRTIATTIKLNGATYCSSQFETPAYFMVNGSAANGSRGFYLYNHQVQYARLFVSAVGTVATADAAGTAGCASLYLGNATAQPAAGATTTGANNAYGRILLYGTGTNYTILRSNPSGDRTMYLPEYGGTGYLVCRNTAGGVGAASTPVYVDANGCIQACTAYNSATASIANKLKTTQATNATKMFILGQSAAGAGQDTYIATAYTSGSANKTGIYFQGSTGVLMGAAWNDYAEFRQSKENKIIEPGRVVYENGDDTLSTSNERLMRGCSIVSDTYGFGIGESEEAQLPIAVSGRVLTYPYESREEFKNHIGWPVCSGPNGTVSIMTEEEEIKYPSRIIGTISAVPDYEIWHGGTDIVVDGRVWIKVK